MIFYKNCVCFIVPFIAILFILSGCTRTTEVEEDPISLNINPKHAIAAGNYFSMVICANGDLWVWGRNTQGQLGDGTTEDRHAPVRITNDTVAVSAGGMHSFAVSADNSLWAWGDNGRGRLGDGTTENRLSPVHILDEVIAISASRDVLEAHSLAIGNDGVLWAWGTNSGGRLGDGTTRTSYLPVSIIDDATAVSSGGGSELGGSHSLAITTDGGLWAWGNNRHGQLGDGTTENRHYPVKIMDNVIAVSAGLHHSMAISADGTLWAWGSNVHGRLGDGTSGTREGRLSPVKIMDNVIAISAGNRNSMAITYDGVLWAWGSNTDGRLGDGTTRQSSSPVRIMDDVIAVSTGNFHSLAIGADGSLWAWGSNEHGQLGDGTTEDRHYPIRIMEDVLMPQGDVSN